MSRNGCATQHHAIPADGPDPGEHVMGLVENLKIRGPTRSQSQRHAMQSPRHDPGGHRAHRGLCAVCPIGGHLGPPALVHDLRDGRVLRFVQEPARQQARRAVCASDRRVPGTGRGLVVVLRRSGHRGTPDHRSMTVSPADAGAPVLVAFEAHPAVLERVGNELRQRYGRDCEIVTAPLPSVPGRTRRSGRGPP